MVTVGGWLMIPVLGAMAAIGACAADSLQAFGRSWSVPVAADWKISGGGDTEILRLVEHRGPLPGPRRPIQFALTELPPYKRLAMEVDVMPLGQSLMMVFAYRDEAHFDYAHLSVDTAAQQPVHNGIFHVYGGERVRISPDSGPAAFAANHRWFHVLLRHDAQSGAVEVQVDGKPVPALQAVDKSLGAGRAGLGSFDETADFKNVRLTTEP